MDPAVDNIDPFAGDRARMPVARIGEQNTTLSEPPPPPVGLEPARQQPPARNMVPALCREAPKRRSYPPRTMRCPGEIDLERQVTGVQARRTSVTPPLAVTAIEAAGPCRTRQVIAIGDRPSQHVLGGRRADGKRISISRRAR